MAELRVKLGAALVVLFGLSACGGSPSAPTAGLQIIGMDVARGGSPGDYTYSIELHVKNAGGQAVTIKSLTVVVSQNGTPFYNVSIGPSPATATINGKQQASWGPINATHVSSPGDTMTLTVTYVDASGAEQQVSANAHLGS